MLRARRHPVIAFTLAAIALIGAAIGPGRLFTGRPGALPLFGKSHAAATAVVHSQTTTTTTTEPPTTSTAAAPAPTTTPAQSPQGGCDAALVYLRANANPAFTVECPGNAYGHEAMTCAYRAGFCPGQAVIAIADPCPAAYMNEAANSWILFGLRPGPLDPYGSC